VREWLDELRLEPGPPYSMMGTRALDPDSWLLFDGDRDVQLGRKAQLIDEHRAIVFGALPDSDAASEEVLELVQDALAAQGVVTPRPIDDHPLIRAASMVQEDLVVLQRLDGAWTLTAGVVCFPTHWTVTNKLGLSLAGIHEPVAHYANELRERVDRFHDRLTVDHPVWRRNWFVLPTDELFLPDREDFAYPEYTVRSIEPDGSPMWIRSERQTLRRMRRTDGILFTIRVQQMPLGVLLDRRDIAARMLDTTRSWDATKRAYTSTGGVLDELIEWLSGVADATSPRRST